MTQEEYEKLLRIRRILRRWKKQGKIADYRIEYGALTMVGIRYNPSSGHKLDWMFYSIEGFIRKFKIKGLQ